MKPKTVSIFILNSLFAAFCGAVVLFMFDKIYGRTDLWMLVPLFIVSAVFSAILETRSFPSSWVVRLNALYNFTIGGVSLTLPMLFKANSVVMAYGVAGLVAAGYFYFGICQWAADPSDKGDDGKGKNNLRIRTAQPSKGRDNTEVTRKLQIDNV